MSGLPRCIDSLDGDKRYKLALIALYYRLWLPLWKKNDITLTFPKMMGKLSTAYYYYYYYYCTDQYIMLSAIKLLLCGLRIISVLWL